MVFETVLQADLQRAVQVVQLRGNLFSADNGGNKITVDILDGGEPATVSGTVSGYVIRDDNKTVVIEGSLSGNKASITLPSSAYAVIGPVSIVIKVGTTTVAACTSFVYQTTTDVIVDPGEVIPSIAELLAMIDACEEATANANAAAAAAGTAAENVATIVAPAFAQATANDPDTYVTKDGKMYYLPDGHTAGTTWENTTKTETKVGSEISNLKSAIETKADIINCSVSGDFPVLTISDGADNQPMALEIGIDPVQDLHGYDYPWVGGAGKNLYNKDGTDTNNGYEAGKILNSSGTAVAPGSPQYWCISEYIPVKPSTAYVISGMQNRSGAGVIYCVEYDTNKDIVQTVDQSFATTTFTTESTAKYIRLTIEVDEKPTVQLESGSTATSYAPYSNICPITGWTGAVLTKKNKNARAEGTDTTNGYVSTKLLKSNNSTQGSQNYNISEYFKVNPNQRYTYSFGSTSSEAAVCFYDENKEFISPGYKMDGKNTIVVTSPANACYARISIQKSTSSTIGYTQFEVGDVKTAYEAPTTVTITIPFLDGTDPLTVYGGTLKINKDGSGVLKDKAVKRTFPEVSSISNSSLSGSTGKFVSWTDDTYSYLADNSKVCVIAEKVKTVAHANRGQAWEMYVGSYNTIGMFVPSNATVEEVNAVTEGMEIVVELASATQYSLTAQQVKSLLEVNNIYADCGNILSCDYSADTKAYVDGNNTAQDAEITATKEIIGDSMSGTASRAIDEGELFIMNNTLYKATADIANGETITPNTNCEATKIADEIGTSRTMLDDGIWLEKNGRTSIIECVSYVDENLETKYPTISDLLSQAQYLINCVNIPVIIMDSSNHEYPGYIEYYFGSYKMYYINNGTKTEATDSWTVKGKFSWIK